MNSQVIKIYAYGTPQFIGLPLEYINKTKFTELIRGRKLMVSPEEFRGILSGFLKWKKEKDAPQKKAVRKFAFDYRSLRHG